MREPGGSTPLLARSRARISGWAVRGRELCPFTKLSVFVMGLSIGGLYYYGFGQLDLVWYVAAIAGLGAVAACVLLVSVACVWVRHTLGKAPASTPGQWVTQLPFTTGFSLTRLRFWPLLETDLGWLTPADARLRCDSDGGSWREIALLSDHGELRQVWRRVTVRDVLGLSALTLRVRAKVEWDVLPHRGALGSVPWLSSLSGGDDIPHPMGIEAGDRLELQRYSPGDPARFIHWKVYARTRKLVVRKPERALSRAHRTAAYLVAGQSDGASAASVLAAMEAGAFGGDWLFGADGCPQSATTPEEVRAAVRRSASARGRGGQGISAFVAEATARGPVSWMLFVPPHGGDWEAPVTAALRNSVHTPRVVVGVDSVHDPQPVPLWRRVALMNTSASDGVNASALRGLTSRLRATGAEVWVAERRSGRLLGPQQLRAVTQGRKAA